MAKCETIKISSCAINTSRFNDVIKSLLISKASDTLCLRLTKISLKLRLVDC